MLKQPTLCNMQARQPMTVVNSNVTCDSCAWAIHGHANTVACAICQNAVHLACLTNLCMQPYKSSLEWLSNFLTCTDLSYTCPACQSQLLGGEVITSVLPQGSTLLEIKTALCNLEKMFLSWHQIFKTWIAILTQLKNAI